MDVRCEQCGTEYEFDDNKVTEAGITVKCTHCGHLFRVVRQVGLFPRPAEPPRLPPEPTMEWRLRNQRGEIIPFRDLVTLQEWIVQGKVSRHDEISKTGENWKPLGSIVELSSFFISAQASSPGLLEPAPGYGSQDGFATGSFAGSFTGADASWAEHNFDTGRLRMPPEPTPGAFQTGHIPMQGSGGGIRTQTSGAFPLPPHLSFQGLPAPPPSKGRAAWGFILGMLVTAGLIVGGYFGYERFLKKPQVEVETPTAAQQDPRLIARLKRADAAWRRDNLEGFAQAATGYTEVLTSLGSPPSDLTLAVEAHLGRAAVAITQAEYAKDAKSTLEQAELELAQAAHGDTPRMHLMYADFYRLKGEFGAAEEHLYKAKQGGADADMVAWLSAGLKLSKDVAKHPEAKPAREEAEPIAAEFKALSERAKALPRVRYLYALALYRAGQADAARAQLNELITLNKNHPAAKGLLEQLSDTKAAEPKAPEEKSKNKRATNGGGGGSFDGLMRRGNRDLENGRTSRARKAFLGAIKKNPRSVEALANLGWCDLSDGNASGALRYFERALGISSRFADALYGKAKALESMGRREQAVAAYKKYLDRHPRGSKANMVKRKLERLAP